MSKNQRSDDSFPFWEITIRMPGGAYISKALSPEHVANQMGGRRNALLVEFDDLIATALEEHDRE